MRMRALKTTFVAALALALALVLVACSAGNGDSATPDTGSPDVGSPAAGLRLAPGLYDLGDGTVQAVGTLAYTDLEGGFWLIVDGTADDDTVVVIANGDELDATLKPLEGLSVVATGMRFDGVSIRMAGPEMEVETIEAFDDTNAAVE